MTAAILEPPDGKKRPVADPGAQVPALPAWADRDVVLPRREMRRIAAVLSDADTTTIANAGHLLQEDQPQAVARAVTSFLAQPAQSLDIGRDVTRDPHRAHEPRQRPPPCVQ